MHFKTMKKSNDKHLLSLDQHDFQESYIEIDLKNLNIHNTGLVFNI
jgi:hypothetical protein